MNASPITPSPAGDTLLLSRDDVAALLTLEDCMDAVENAFSAAARGLIGPPAALGFPATDGGFHIKAAALAGKAAYFAAKLNGNFFMNRTRHGLPNIQGLILLCDGNTGTPLAVLDSIEVTILRTGAATGVAARHLALKEARVLAVCGCGNQGSVSIRAIVAVRQIEHIRLWDIDPAAAERLGREIKERTACQVTLASSPAEAARGSEVIVTCTPSKTAFLRLEDVRTGAFIAAVGADNEEKQEIDPGLMKAARIVADRIEQCATFGDLHHAIKAGAVSKADVHAEIGEVIAGMKTGRESEEQVIVFDSTGTALQDVAAAAVVYEKALASGRGSRFRFA